MFSDFIDEKGVRALSIVFDVPMPTVYSWRRRGVIPRDRWDRLMEVWPALTYRQLRDMEIASRADQTA